GTGGRGGVYVRVGPLLTGRVEFGDITLQRPRIALFQNAEGRLNVASLAPPADSKTTPRPTRSGGGAAGGAAAAIVSRVKIDKGLITYRAQGEGPRHTPEQGEELDGTLNGHGTLPAPLGAGRAARLQGPGRGEAGRSHREARRRRRRGERRQDPARGTCPRQGRPRGQGRREARRGRGRPDSRDRRADQGRFRARRNARRAPALGQRRPRQPPGHAVQPAPYGAEAPPPPTRPPHRGSE